MKPLLRTLLLVAALGSPVAAAEVQYVVESAPLETRDVADAHLAAVQSRLSPAQQSGLILRVVRRFVRGSGWQYFVAVEGIPERERVAELEAALAHAEGPASAWMVDGMDREPIPLAAAAPSRKGRNLPEARAEQDEERGRERSAQAVLRAAVKAHGGEEGALALLEAAPAVRFEFIRRLPQGDGELVARHRYLRQGKAMRLEVEILKGEGRSSTTVLTPDGAAWVATEDEVVERDPERVLEVLLRFAPEEILGTVLGLPRDVQTTADWRDLQRSGPSGGREVMLKPSLEAGSSRPADGLVEASFDADRHLLLRLRWQEAGSVTTFHYDDWRGEAPGLVTPGRIRIEQGGSLLEELEIERLDLPTSLPASEFSVPRR